MRQRVVRVALTAALVAVALLAVPLALAIRSSLYADQRDTLERSALAGALRVSPDYTTGDPAELPRPPAGGRLGLYDPQSRLRAGSGPDAGDAPVRRALGGEAVRGHSGGDLVVTVPVSHAEKVIGVVRASSPAVSVRERVLAVWAVLLGVAALALAVAVGIARRQARALAAPLEDLSRHCRAVTEGDLNARAAPSSVAEIDQVARTHNEMLHSLSELLRHERDFTANASHQLRTPLTGLQLALEAGLAQDDDARLRPVLNEALATTHRLHHTVEEVLRLSRAREGSRPATGKTAVRQLLREAEERWHGVFARDGRRLECAARDAPADALVPGTPVSEVLGILLDNARVHGRGTVRVTVRDLEDALAFDVSDEGAVTGEPARLFDRGHTGGGQGAGIGLALARDLAVSLGGRLSLTSAHPATFTLLLPVDQDEAQGAPG
ncbi:HAMP domain-containing sensor histidine kinase [Streptomyces stelliscabiei]|uniref:HAMP domain-containing sensor histidine kinase n=1 Tax=Streptomyces stelliscabiei TaxID=146820 RepID=UPI0029BED8C6|nr:HAMP domain-containing sensor histidine kinase [Streptomyces stelliscabiei]MDX3435760.1 HAMP domain-containing sensor histidine kinase [Streptomyces stelliscabiei]MDX3621941.1 HAMP domain-containing sensor histidine kinase [Streptomyces stelliscabiei]